MKASFGPIFGVPVGAFFELPGAGPTISAFTSMRENKISKQPDDFGRARFKACRALSANMQRLSAPSYRR